MQGIDIFFGVVVLIFSIILHEVAHGYMAEALGDPTPRLAGRLTLNPLKHLDPWGSIVIPGILILTNAGFLIGWAKPVPFNPYQLSNKRWGAAIVAIAGPLTNLLIAIIVSLLARLAVSMGYLTPGIETPAGAMIGSIVIVNCVLAVFNLIPVPPLDGHHILSAILPWPPLRHFLESNWIVLMVLVLFVLWRLFTPVVILLYNFLVGDIIPTPFI